MAHGNDLQLDANTHLRPVYDPALRGFSVQLWRDGKPAGTHGLVEHLAHADDVLDTIDEFLEKSGVRPLAESEIPTLAHELIMAKGGPDAAILSLMI